MRILVNSRQHTSLPILIVILGSTSVGILIGWILNLANCERLTLFVILPVLSCLAGIVSTWSP